MVSSCALLSSLSLYYMLHLLVSSWFILLVLRLLCLAINLSSLVVVLISFRCVSLLWCFQSGDYLLYLFKASVFMSSLMSHTMFFSAVSCLCAEEFVLYLIFCCLLDYLHHLNKAFFLFIKSASEAWIWVYNLQPLMPVVTSKTDVYSVSKQNLWLQRGHFTMEWDNCSS